MGTAVPIPPSVRVGDSFGNPVPDVMVTFTVTGGNGAVTGPTPRTNSGGVAAVGSWTLGSTVGTNRLSAEVAGLPPVTFTATGGGAFSITIQYLSSPTAREQQAVQRAVSRWQRVIVGDLPDIGVTFAAGSCGSDSPTVSGTIDDVLVFVDFSAIDGPGGFLGQAGPCYIRNPENAPLMGRMTIDGADVASMQSNGTLDDVVLHEMGHVLGIGTIWQTAGLLANPGTDDVTFTGPLAGAAFRAAGGGAFAGPPVPVENCVGVSGCGTGTRDRHWRESVMGRELMTGYISPPGTPNPLSAITVQSLADLGYVVDPGAADPYRVGAGLLTAPSGAPPMRLQEAPPDWPVRRIAASPPLRRGPGR